MGMTNPDGTQFYETAGHSDDYVGYYDVSADAYESNFESAVETLKKYYTYDESTGMFTDFPTLTYLYNTSEAHKAIGEYLQSAMAAVGITMNLENQEWATFLNTRKAGDYSIARNGWVADYNDPICFLDMWVTNSGNNDVQFGKGNAADAKVYSLDLTSYGYDTKVENGTWAETYDVLISDIKSCTDHRDPLRPDARGGRPADEHGLHRPAVLLHRHLHARQQRPRLLLQPARLQVLHVLHHRLSTFGSSCFRRSSFFSEIHTFFIKAVLHFPRVCAIYSFHEMYIFITC